MRIAVALFAALALSGCGSTWTVEDGDGDGFSIVDGDCDDGPGGSGVGPGAEEIWYNGVDENCDGNDADQDGDGYLAVHAGGDDCFDDPAGPPEEFTALNGFAQPTAAEVYPGAADTWYDGIDQDCAGDDDFDQDLDGFATTAWTEVRSSLPASDCYDATSEAYPEIWPECMAVSEQVIDAPLSPPQVNPAATDVVYDGTDANCDGLTDFDSDGDAYDACEECDDDDASIFPNDAEEIWYNGVDENCDGNDADQDGDNYLVEGYVEPAERIHTGKGEGDCWDDPGSRPDEMEAINGFADPDADEVHPGQSEVWYDGVDQDCAGDDDFDQDADGDPTDELPSRDSNPAGADCDDEDGTISSTAADAWYDGVDSNCDGESDYDQDGDGHDAEGYGVAGADDCDDSKATVNPDRQEACSTTYDDDCDNDGNTNDDDAIGCVEYFDDADADSYGDIDDSRCLCTDEGTYTELGTTSGSADCDDTRAQVNPGISNEDCTTTYDDDCDGVTNTQDGDSCTTYYLDADNDGYGSTTSQCWCSATGNYDVINDDDCDDSRSAVNPAVSNESCSTSYDDDCDGSTNERNGTGCTTYYYDTDSDGYGTTSSQCWCSPAGDYTSSYSTDCDDSDDNTFPGAASNDSSTSCMTDADGDNYGDSSAASPVTAGTDCDDSRSGVKPGATETCGTSYDDDCDGSSNDTGAVGCTTYYYDADGDTYGTTTSQCTCSATGDYDATNDDDCDDASAADNPAATETVGNGDDDDCSGGETCYDDDDNDGYLDSTGDTRASTDNDCADSYEGTNTDPTTDCDDADADTFPGAASNDSTSSCMNDDDGDNYGDATVSGSVVAGTDCDDTRSAVKPGATETCSTSYDDDCDSSSNDVGATGCTTYYYDGDNDGYGLSTSSQCTCTTSGSYDVTLSTDCDDSSSSDYPGATETVGNGDDEDCDGYETCYDDDDNDGYLDTTGDTRASSDTDCSDAYEGTNSDPTTDCDDSDSGDTRASSDTDCSDAYEGTNSDPTTDCDDSDSGDYPGATETVGNGDDEDCDGYETCYDDDDNDGFLDTTGDTRTSTTDTDCADAYEGTSTDLTTDCDDSDATAYPGASDTLVGNDGIDNDCDDFVDEGGMGSGDLVITEYMVGGSAYTADWFEVYNASGYDVTLDNFTITLCSDSATSIADPNPSLITCDYEIVLTVESGHTVPADDYFVFCASSGNFSNALICPSGATSSDGDRWTDYDIPAYDATTRMGDDNGGIAVEAGAVFLDEVFWWQENGLDDWPQSSTSSIQLDLSVSTGTTAEADNDDYTDGTDDVWCTSTGAGVIADYSASAAEYGTPGSANSECP
ncbi:MAG: lamin tail domain-containing protein [Deltaproteobacteria bacterium]|nr:lamin tail domain-containing protein [Deltaproteobacteria bacterium]